MRDGTPRIRPAGWEMLTLPMFLNAIIYRKSLPIHYEQEKYLLMFMQLARVAASAFIWGLYVDKEWIAFTGAAFTAIGLLDFAFTGLVALTTPSKKV